MSKINQILLQARQNVSGLPGQLLASFNVKADSELPEHLRKPFQDFNARAGRIAAAIPEAAEEDAAAPALAQALQGVLEGQNAANTVIVALHGKLDEATQAVASFNKRIEDGELIAKDKATELARLTAEQEVQKAEGKFKTRMTRLQSIRDAGLPVPADEAMLDGEQEAFDGAVTAAKGRAEKLGKLGVSLQKAPKHFADGVWSDTECERITELFGAVQPVTPAKPTGHPFTPAPAPSSGVLLG